MYRIMKKLIAILCIVGILIPNFNLQGYSQTLGNQLSLTVARDSNGVYKITKNSISIKWSAVEEATYYTVEAAYSNSRIDFSTVTTNTYCDITGLAPATLYKITVSAKDQNDKVITSQSIYVITEFKLSAQPEPDPAKEEDIPLGSGGEHPKLIINFNKINISSDFQNDVGFRGYNIFIGKSPTASDANQYFVDSTTNEVYKYQKDVNTTIPIRLIKDGQEQFASEERGIVSLTVYDKYDGIDTPELYPGTMYYIIMNPKLDNTAVIYKPLNNISCSTLMQVSAAKIGEIEKDGKILALVRVQWKGVDPGNYKQDEIKYQAYYATSANELPRDNLPPQNIFATTSYYQNEAYIPGLSMTTKYYYIRVEAVFADGTRIPSALIKVSVTELTDIPPTPRNCQAEKLSQTEIKVSLDKPVSDDAFYRYQIWYSTQYQDVLDANNNPTVYKLVYPSESYNPNIDGFVSSDFIKDGTRYSYIIKNLSPNTVYYFKIRIINVANPDNPKKSDFSLVFVGTTETIPTLLVPPIDDNFVTKIDSDTDKIVIYTYQDDLLKEVHDKVYEYVKNSVTFADYQNIQESVYYQVYVCESVWDESKVVKHFEFSSDDLKNQNRIEINNLKQNTVYYLRFKIRVVLLDKNYFSDFSKAYVVATKPKPVPPTISRPEIPKNFMIAPEDGALTQVSVKLRWDTKQSQSYVILQTFRPLEDNSLSLDDTINYFTNTLKQKVEIYSQSQSGGFVLEKVVYDPNYPNAPVGAKVYKYVTSPCVFNNLAPNTLYYFSIKAIENGLESYWGSIAITTSPIEKPENLIILSRDSSGHGLTVQWQGSQAYGYQIFVKTESDTGFTLVYSGNITPSSIIDSRTALFKYYIGNLKSNTLYYIRVRSIHIPTGKVSLFAEVLGRTLFNQSDFEQDQQKVKEQEENRIREIQSQKQTTVVLENSSDRYFLYVIEQNALDEIERSNSNEFIIDLTKALYSNAKGQVQFSYRVADKLEKMQKTLVIKYKNATIKVPAGALNVPEVEMLSKRYNIDKGNILLFAEVALVSWQSIPSTYSVDSDVISLKFSAKYYYNDDILISNLSKPINVTMFYNTPIVLPNETRAVYSFSDGSFISSFSVDKMANKVMFNTTKTGIYGVLKTSASLNYTSSKYKDDIVYLAQKYNLYDLYSSSSKVLTQEYAETILNTVFASAVENIKNGYLTRQEAIYLLAKVYETKKNTSVDNILITKSTNFNPDERYKKYILSMMSIGVVDMDLNPVDSINVDEFVHYVINLERLLNF